MQLTTLNNDPKHGFITIMITDVIVNDNDNPDLNNILYGVFSFQSTLLIYY